MTESMTGARAVFSIGTKIIAIAQNCTYTDSDQLQSVEVLGRETPAEHAELGRTIEFTVDTVRVLKASATELGLSTKLQDLLEQDGLDAKIEDKIDNKSLFEVTGVKKQNRTGTLEIHQTSQETILLTFPVAGGNSSYKKRDNNGRLYLHLLLSG